MQMTNTRTLAFIAALMATATFGLFAQDAAHYRNFTLGTDLAAVSKLAGVAASEAKTIHSRPAVLQELEWRPSRWVPGASTPSSDPAENVRFGFYNGQLFRVVVDYS